MPDAEDTAILRQVIRAVAAAILCLLSGGIAGVLVVRDDGGVRVGEQRGELAPHRPSKGPPD